jgi:hypothetical protein
MSKLWGKMRETESPKDSGVQKEQRGVEDQRRMEDQRGVEERGTVNDPSVNRPSTIIPLWECIELSGPRNWLYRFI